MTDKEMAIRRIRELPNRATLEDIAEEIGILAAIREGEKAIAEGRFCSHEEVKRKVKQWLKR
jgi:predicted transcriptional regulator